MSRQKQVFTDNRRIAHLWFHEAQTEARNPQKNFYFSGATIYSYGGHFPIACIVHPRAGKGKGQKTVLFTTRTDSKTTATHLKDVWSAIRTWNGDKWVEAGARIFNVVDVTASNERHAREWDARISSAQNALVDAPKGTRQTTKVKLYDALVSLISQANDWADWFGVKMRWSLPVSIDALKVEITKARAIAEAQAKRDEIKRQKAHAIAEQKRLELRATMAHAWLKYWEFVEIDGEQVRVRVDAYGPAFLRIAEPDEVETSQGVTFPLAHAFKASRVVASIIANGRTFQRNGHQIRLGHFQIDSIDEQGTIRAGCHRIEYAEFQRFALVLADYVAQHPEVLARIDATENQQEVA
jgi:hypothetical protein